MNGKASKRLRLAVLKTLDAGIKQKIGMCSYALTLKRLKREYREMPYHRRFVFKGLRHFTHRETLEQERARRGLK
jgi:hypothetical protein